MLALLNQHSQTSTQKRPALRPGAAIPVRVAVCGVGAFKRVSADRSPVSRLRKAQRAALASYVKHGDSEMRVSHSSNRCKPYIGRFDACSNPILAISEPNGESHNGKTIPFRRGAKPTGAQDSGQDYRGDKTPLPYGFRYAQDGSIERIVGSPKDDGGCHWGWLCSPIEFLATTESAEGKVPGVLVRIRNDSGRWHQMAFPRSALIGGDALLSDLVDHGLKFAPVGKDTAELKRLLMGVVAEKRARCVPHVGWHEHSFVLPDAVIGQSKDCEVVFQPPYTINHHYSIAGTFDGWRKEVAARAVGNSRLTFAISVGFAGPLLKLSRLEGGGFHLRGPSSTGKTSALHVAGSVWGGGGINDFVRSWRTTDNALEGMALIHNDTLLPLDEIAEIDARAAFRTAYMLSNGQGKARSNKTGEVRLSHEWRALFLSTGEISLASKVAEDGRKATAGQEVRVIDIPVDAGAGMGIFEQLHGFNRPSHLAEALRDATQRHHGHAARAFLTELVKDVPGFTQEVREALGAIAQKICPERADGQVRRVANRFALAACAGELAILFGIVPWEKKTAFLAAQRCFEDWLRARGGIGKKEESDAVDTVLGFIMRYSSRFRRLDNLEANIPDCAGFVRDTERYRDTEIGQVTERCRTFYIFSAVFRTDICGKNGIDHDHAADVLAARGMLIKSADGKRTRQERLPSVGHQRVYVVTLPTEDDE
jgi:putative DNA primase/helicase